MPFRLAVKGEPFPSPWRQPKPKVPEREPATDVVKLPRIKRADRNGRSYYYYVASKTLSVRLPAPTEPNFAEAYAALHAVYVKDVPDPFAKAGRIFVAAEDRHYIAYLRHIAALKAGKFPAAPAIRGRKPKVLKPIKERKVYFIGGDDGPIKIGFSANPERRLAYLQKQHAFDLRILATRRGGRIAEKSYHRQFGEHRERSEWFTRCPAIMREIERLTSQTEKAAI